MVSALVLVSTAFRVSSRRALPPPPPRSMALLLTRPLAAARHLTSSSSSSSGNSTPNRGQTPPESVYVHPLSQIVLAYLQDDCHEWIVNSGLEQGLKVHSDGSFSLDSATARIWTLYCPDQKRHYLAFSSNQVHYNFLLQDNLRSAWHHGNKRTSLHLRIQQSVRDLIQASSELE